MVRRGRVGVDHAASDGTGRASAARAVVSAICCHACVGPGHALIDAKDVVVAIHRQMMRLYVPITRPRAPSSETTPPHASSPNTSAALRRTSRARYQMQVGDGPAQTAAGDVCGQQVLPRLKGTHQARRGCHGEARSVEWTYSRCGVDVCEGGLAQLLRLVLAPFRGKPTTQHMGTCAAASAMRMVGLTCGHGNGARQNSGMRGIPRSLHLRKVLLVVVSVPTADLALGVAREEAIATTSHVEPVDHGALIRQHLSHHHNHLSHHHNHLSASVSPRHGTTPSSLKNARLTLRLTEWPRAEARRE